MTDERLKEIKDSLNFQLDMIKILDLEDLKEMLQEEKELFDEVVRLRELKEKAIKHIKVNLRHDILSDFTGQSYLQEYMIKPSGLLDILNGGKENE